MKTKSGGMDEKLINGNECMTELARFIYSARTPITHTPYIYIKYIYRNLLRRFKIL